ncbi:hypothetical protein ElyMa_004447300 [Elysia marginata]|uniref:C-type lectin domain-containing protein n=1 Tax=Elysia marginata TaxID=1093978 RepID=A0AAV4HGN9_9GAST|nr:hypothetical protein ElyMa_004447300 [Elysia marginata]
MREIVLIPLLLEVHLINIVVVASSFYFKKDTHKLCLKARLSAPWKSHDKFACLAECKKRFRDRCTNFIFNNETLTCSPVHPLSHDRVTLASQPGDVLYTQDHQRALSCDTAAGFRFRQACGAAACVLVRYSKVVFSAANDKCLRKNASLYMPDTFERFALLQTLVYATTWIGMVKSHNDSVLWLNGSRVDSDFFHFFWKDGQFSPQNEAEDCFVFQVANGIISDLHDYPCSWHWRYVCEQSY